MLRSESSHHQQYKTTMLNYMVSNYTSVGKVKALRNNVYRAMSVGRFVEDA